MVVYLIVRPSVGRGFKTRRCLLRKTCIVCLVVRPSVGRGLRLEDVSLRKLALFT